MRAPPGRLTAGLEKSVSLSALGRNTRPGTASSIVEDESVVGQAADFADRYREYLPRILNYVRLKVDGEDLAQDLTAEVFERALAKQHTLRKQDAFAGWLFAIARNVVAAHYRQRRPTVPLDVAGDRPAAGRQPDEAAAHQEELARLRAALATLSEREQEIIRLRFAAGLGNNEIAEIVGLRATHVAVIVYRALQKLRDLLQEE
jgi:RNA polymerase sigma factor (sigma-70 family)